MLDRAYCNGVFVDTKDLKISGKDLGIHRAYGIFDFFKLRNRQNPWIEWYMNRLENSLMQTRLSIHMDRSALLGKIEQLLDENEIDDAYIKIVVTAGDSPNGYTRSNKENVFLFAMSLPASDIESKSTGVLISDEYRRDFPYAKTTNYMRSCILQPEMDAAGAIDVLYYWNGVISEASRSNIFVATDGKFKTPAKDILNGITRQRVLSLQIPEISIEEAEITIEEVFNADEVFITSSTKGIMPILSIDERLIANGEVGPLSTRLMQDINSF